tara:strand:- start:43 stop:1029 length:987 start_codon:yes stop_codon:yes gene_type:complete
MAVDKKVKYDMQGGVRNYLGKQKQVKAPLKWQSSPDHPTTELAYITQAEKDLLVKQDLHGSLNGGVNRGPSGIMSLNGFGSADESQNVSGTAASAAETGSSNSRDRAQVRSEMSGSGPSLPPGVTSQTAKDFRSAAIAAGAGQRVNPGFFDSRNTVSPIELARARAINPAAFRTTRGGGLGSFFTGGGFLGNIVRGLGQKFGLGKTYDQPTYDFGNEYLEELAEEEDTMMIPNVGSFGIIPKRKPSQQFIEELAPNLADPVIDQVGNIDDLMAKLATNSPALAQLRSLQKKQVLSGMGGPEFTLEDQQKLNMLEQMETDPVNIYSQTV